MKAWRLHARTGRFRARIEASRRVVDGFFAMSIPGKFYAGCSGGKDSVAMGGILESCGALDCVPLVYAHTPLTYPDTLETVQATAERLNADLHVVEPDDVEAHVDRVCRQWKTEKPQPGVEGYSVLDLLRAIPADVDITSKEAMAAIGRCCASGNMCIAWMYEHEYRGSFVGLRAAESKAREAYAKFHGAVYKHVTDDTWSVCPMLGWSSDDVFAYLLERDLPIHPYYERAWGLVGGEHPGRLRVDLGIVSENIASHGALATVAKVYPEWWASLRRLRPELARHQ